MTLSSIISNFVLIDLFNFILDLFLNLLYSLWRKLMFFAKLNSSLIWVTCINSRKHLDSFLAKVYVDCNQVTLWFWRILLGSIWVSTAFEIFRGNHAVSLKLFQEPIILSLYVGIMNVCILFHRLLDPRCQPWFFYIHYLFGQMYLRSGLCFQTVILGTQFVCWSRSIFSSP